MNLIEEMYFQSYLSRTGAIIDFSFAILLLIAALAWKYILQRRNKQSEKQLLEKISREHASLDIKNIEDLYSKSTDWKFFITEVEAKEEQRKLNKENIKSFVLKHHGDHYPPNTSGFVLFVIKS